MEGVPLCAQVLFHNLVFTVYSFTIYPTQLYFLVSHTTTVHLNILTHIKIRLDLFILIVSQNCCFFVRQRFQRGTENPPTFYIIYGFNFQSLWTDHFRPFGHSNLKYLPFGSRNSYFACVMCVKYHFQNHTCNIIFKIIFAISFSKS